MTQGLFELSGAQAPRPVKAAPLFIEDLWVGYFSNRSALHDPSGLYERKYLGGRPGSIISGSNVEVSVRNTIIRRYGLTEFSTATYPTPPDRSVAFELTTGAIQVIVDTEAAIYNVTAVNTSSGGLADYSGSFCGGANNGFAGSTITITGFVNVTNNGNFLCVSSSATDLILENTNAITETHAALAEWWGAVYFDQQAGSNGTLALTSVTNSKSNAANEQSPTATYFGVITGGANNAFSGLHFVVTGFTNPSNNGTFICLSSTATTLVLLNGGATAETNPASAVSSGKILLFDKSPGAGQTYFSPVGGILYLGDSVDTRKYTPLNPNGLIWNWGIATPTVAPAITITESASSAVTWQASTVFSTMGLIVDGNGNAEALISVQNPNAVPLNTSQIFGTTGNGEPAWNPNPGGTTTDGGVTWTNWGPIPAWTAETVYNNASVGGNAVNASQIYDPTTNTVQINIAAGFAQGKSGDVKPNFVAQQGATLHDPPGGNTPPNVKWFSIFPPPAAWIPNHAYTTFLGTDTANTAIVEPSALPAGTGQTVTLQICTISGTSGSAGTQPPFPPLGTSGTQTGDGDLIWLSLGSATRANSSPYSAWSGQGSTFSAIKVGSRMYVCTATGVSASSPPSFAGTKYGDQIGDGSVTWTDVGPSMVWAASTQWYLPLVGFAPPSSSQPYGGALIVDSNGDLETVIASGKSGSPTHPSWNSTGNTTSDGTITWFNTGVANTNSLAVTAGHTYAYSYKARSLSDFYSVPINGVLPIPPGFTAPPYPPGFAPLPPSIGSLTGAVSTASPITAVGINTGAVYTLKIPYSNDPQVDTIIIWRSPDETNGSANMLELTEIPNIPQPAGTVKYAFFTDYLPDIPTTINGIEYPGLNPLIPAPIDDVNDPPLSTFLPMEYNFQRIWGSLGQSISFSGGPDTLVGNPNEAFNPSDNLPFLSTVVRAVKSTQGLVVYTTSSLEMILGGPLTSSFYSVTLAPGIGLGNFNALDIYAGEQFFMDTTGVLRVLSPTLSLTTAGFAIADQLILFNPKTAYIAFNEQPNDVAIYVGTGSTPYNGSTGWFRANPRQIPGGPNGPEPVWSPFASITPGCQMLQSIEVSPGVKKLLVGGTSCNEPILERNTSVYTDNGTEYDANFQIGNIWLVRRGEIAELKFIEADFALVTTNPTVGYLLNEISGTFLNFPQQQFDPPDIYGKTLAPTSYNPLRFYFSANPDLARCVHMQVSFDFGTSPNADEIFDFTIYGSITKGR